MTCFGPPVHCLPMFAPFARSATVALVRLPRSKYCSSQQICTTSSVRLRTFFFGGQSPTLYVEDLFALHHLLHKFVRLFFLFVKGLPPYMCFHAGYFSALAACSGPSTNCCLVHIFQKKRVQWPRLKSCCMHLSQWLRATSTYDSPQYTKNCRAKTNPTK